MFANRQEAGVLLGEKLRKYRSPNSLVLSIPRGGVVVGFEIAKVLGAPLDVILARKIGAPGNPEFGLDAVCEDVSDPKIRRRRKLYRQDRPLPDMRGKTIILVDDGIATGVTAKAAIRTIKKKHPEKIILSVPVLPRDAISEFKKEVADLVYLLAPLDLGAVGNFYADFSQVSDEGVLELLGRSREIIPT